MKGLLSGMPQCSAFYFLKAAECVASEDCHELMAYNLMPLGPSNIYLIVGLKKLLHFS